MNQLGSTMEAQEAPKSRPKPENIDVKKTAPFQHRFFKGSDLVLEGFGRFLSLKMHEKNKNAKLAKTLKIVIFLREN